MKNKKYRDKDWLKEKYQDKKMTSYEIAGIANCGKTTILRWLNKHGIETRNKGGYKGSIYHINLTPFAQQFLDGLMLGDGGMGAGSKSAQYWHGDTFQEYIQWLSEKLSQIGLESKTKERPDGHYLWTKSYRELKGQYEQWYPDGHGKTKIPSWVEVTPITLFNWYIGDGTYSQGRLKIGSTTFGEDLFRMIDQIKGLGISCAKAQEGIYIHKESHKNFFDYIFSSGIRIPPGYKRKFPEKYRQKIGDYDE